jgi:digeranylgeranylglycerophospholipid reductase
LIKDFYDVVVVGGGPAGSMAAIQVSKSGYSVCILEKDRDIGVPVRCGEAIGYSGLNQFYKPKSSWIAAELNGIDLISPNGIDVNVDFKSETGYILNRKVFDYDLSRIAVENGSEVYTKSYVKDLIIKDGYVVGVIVNNLNKTLKVKAKLVIGADGIGSRIGRLAGIKTKVRMKDMESCIQYSVSNIHINQQKMKMYIGSKYAPGGYLWIFPKGDGLANIGLGISGKYSKNKSAKKYLDEFIIKNYPDVSILTSVCVGVPCPKPMINPINNGVMLVGDAAHQINPMTGGGIASGMSGGKIGGEIAIEALEANDFSKSFLKKYPKNIFKRFGNNHNRFYRIKEAVNQLNDNDLNYIANKASQIDQNNLTLTHIFKYAIYKKPSILIDVLKVFAGI